MKIFQDSAPIFFHLLLLLQLFVHSASLPTHHCPNCARFESMIRHMGRLQQLSRTLHGLTESELNIFKLSDYKLDHLPKMDHAAAHLYSVKPAEALSQLYLDVRAFELHTEWLKTAREKFSLEYAPNTLEGASIYLQHVSGLLSTALKQNNVEILQPPTPSFPPASTSFDVVRFSIEVSEQLRSFCDWSKRVLHHLKSQCRCL
ncbi:uncharacterized protein il11b [Lampris incognitus]|uniref:uncharacterized protein il11b n=1 Tax=Lampris incognitus TaxID=2546036 RepID=UPI0024B5DE0C|nr:uncharacterized protein il11b [Lampris incognitus]